MIYVFFVLHHNKKYTFKKNRGRKTIQIVLKKVEVQSNAIHYNNVSTLQVQYKIKTLKKYNRKMLHNTILDGCEMNNGRGQKKKLNCVTQICMNVFYGFIIFAFL